MVSALKHKIICIFASDLIKIADEIELSPERALNSPTSHQNKNFPPPNSLMNPQNTQNIQSFQDMQNSHTHQYSFL